MLKREEIRIRDPFILTDTENGCYYMYGTTGLLPSSYSTNRILKVYKSRDLENFDDGTVIFDGEKINFWATDCYWAPEVHKYNGKYYLFVSFKSDGACRATQILVCDTPDGEFKPISESPVTPSDWECLDGTFYEEDGVPYIVFCHEWVQIKNGEIWAMPLTADLAKPAGEPFILFKASENPFVAEIRGEGSGNYVTDGPFMYKENGQLKMIWSSFADGRYQVFVAESDGGIRDKWTHKKGNFDFDGGHAMIFNDLEGKRMISLHSPNRKNFERAAFYEY